MLKGGGLISLSDLSGYKAKERPVLTFPYHSYTILTMPLPSSGGLLLGQMLKMVENNPAMQEGYASADATQVMIEAERRAFADRATYMGDPDFVKVPVATLLSDTYLAERMKDFVPGHAGSSQSVQAGVIPAESTETTHFDVIDQEGNCVSVTTTLSGWYGSKTVAGRAGFLLNNEMDDFSIKPGVPNMFGAIGGTANAIAPRKRMLSSMTPTIVLRDGKPFLIAGTPGGTTIPTSVFQTVVDVIDFHLSAFDAVNHPKFHHQWLPDEVDLERGLSGFHRSRADQDGIPPPALGVVSGARRSSKCAPTAVLRAWPTAVETTRPRDTDAARASAARVGPQTARRPT